jgi:hypothetical protein
MTFVKVGADCRQTDEKAALLLVVVVINLLIYLAALVLNIWTAYHLKQKKTSVYFTVLCCLLSAVFGISVFTVYIAQVVAGLPSSSNYGDGKKYVALLEESNHLIAMLFLFTCVGVLNVSVTWVYVAEKVRTNNTNMANKYRKGINIFFGFFIIALIVLQTDRSFQLYVQYVCIPSILYFSVGFMVGYFRLRTHIQKSIELAKQGGSVASRDKMILIYRTISRTTLLCSIHSCMLILFVVIGAVLGVDGDTPSYPTVSVIYQIAWTFAALLILQVSWYTFSFAGDKNKHLPSEESDQQVAPDTFSSNDPRHFASKNSKGHAKISTTDNGSTSVMSRAT